MIHRSEPIAAYARPRMNGLMPQSDQHSFHYATYATFPAIPDTSIPLLSHRHVILYYQVPNTWYLFLRHLFAVLRRPWVSSRASGCGTRRTPVGTLRRTSGSRPSSFAGALDVQSREIWQNNRGIAFRLIMNRANQAHANPQKGINFQLFTALCFCFSSTRIVKAQAVRVQ